MQVIVPFDETVSGVDGLKTEFPAFEFLDIGAVTSKEPRNDLEEHGIIDIRRARGLSAAEGSLIGVIEDRGWPRPDWARKMVDLHAAHDSPAIGGPVENAAPNTMLSAVFMCDFGRSESPFEAGEREYITDINICYKRAPLHRVKSLWQDRYLEVPVNLALQADGAKLLLLEGPSVVQERLPRPASALFAERFYWGRVFGRVRTEDAGLVRTALLLMIVPGLPFLLFWRHFQMHRAKKRSFGSFCRLAPYLFPLLICWCFGEGVGYIEGANKSSSGGNA